MATGNNEHTHNTPDDDKILTEKEHEEMHKNNHAHVHIRNHGHVTVRIATEEEIEKGIRYIDEDESHGHSHSHGGLCSPHKHDPAHTKKILNRFSRAIGHMQHIKVMVENETDCSEVLIQLAAVKSAVNNIGRELLKEHVAHCIVDTANDDNSDALEMLNTALDQFMK